jgi:cobalamin transport system substrate-binding protein
MIRRSGLMRRSCIAAACLAFAFIAKASQAGGMSLRDDLGREVTLEHSAQRLITLLPSLTETVCALGACDRLVATDRYSNWPEQVRTLPKTGGLDDAQIEEVIRLHPDLVLLSRTQRITDRLHQLGVESFALDTETYAAIARVVTVVGAILGLPDRAVLLNRQIEGAVREQSVRASALRHGPGPSVYFEVDRAPYAAGPESFIGEILMRLGARNIVAADLGAFPRLNPEYVVRLNPDVIFISSMDAQHLAERPGWDQIRAVKERRVCSLAPAQLDIITRPGPRIAEGMRAIEACLEQLSP